MKIKLNVELKGIDGVTEVEDKALRQLTDEYDNYLKYYHSKKEETVAANTTDEDDFTN